MEPFVKTESEGMPTLYILSGWTARFPWLTAGFTSREGGYSEKPYASLNLGLHVGDDPHTVVRNRTRFAQAIGMPTEACTFAEQVHGDLVAAVTAAERGAGRLEQTDALAATDAMATDVPGVCLCALYADCVPLIFVDPDRRVVAVAHAGWKGTALDIAGATVRFMAERYGSDPKRLHAAIGPSIGVCCYEVDERVASPMRELLTKLSKIGIEVPEALVPSTKEGKFRANLQQINRGLLLQAGILSPNIEVSSLCTSCSNDTLFSYRADGGSTGRMAAWIAIRSSLNGLG